MKRTLPALLAVLLVILPVLMTTCGGLGASFDTEEALPLFTEDGRPMVHLSIGVGKTSRALTDGLAKGGVDYYEVAFKDPLYDGINNKRIYRASWDYTQTGRIAVPSGDYSGAVNAILFAGRSRDKKILLAVGLITKVDGVIDTTIIEPYTTSVTFTLGALTNDIKADPASTFQITAPTGYETNTPGAIKEKTLDGVTCPVFRIPENSDEIEATYAVTFPTGTTYGIIIKGAVELHPIGKFYEDDQGVILDQGVIIDGEITDTDKVPSDGVFHLNLNTISVPQGSSGLCSISFDLPVCAISKTDDNPGEWRIRGGTSLNYLDQGGDHPGGAILLAVGETCLLED